MQNIYINVTKNNVLRSSVLMCIVLCGEAPWSDGGGWSLDEYFDFFFKKFLWVSNLNMFFLYFVSTTAIEFIKTQCSTE